MINDDLKKIFARLDQYIEVMAKLNPSSAYRIEIHIRADKMMGMELKSFSENSDQIDKTSRQ